MNKLTTAEIAIMMSEHYNQVPLYYLVNKAPKLASTELDVVKTDLVKKEKENVGLRKAIELMLKLKLEDDVYIDRLMNIIKHLCNDWWFRSDVKQE